MLRLPFVRASAALGAAWALTACLGGGAPGSPTGSTGAPTTACAADAGADAPEDAPPPPPPLSAERVLRRLHLVLHGRPPLDADYAALAAATTDAAREAVLARALEDGLASTDFYDRMLDFGHHWLRNGSYTVGAIGDSYTGNLSTHLGQCPASSRHPGAWFILGESAARGSAACDDHDASGATITPPTRTVQPWWDPRTTVTLIGDAASTAATGTGPTTAATEPPTTDCGITYLDYFNASNPPGCGCGPSAVWCYPGAALNLRGNDAPSQRRDLWDEPARFVAHLAWYDRPLTDLVLGNYTVANNRVRSWYVRFGRQTGLYNARLDGNTAWFHPEMGSAPRDPEHAEPADPEAWRELVQEELAPQLLSLSSGARSADPTRTLHWDPRTTNDPAPGLPSAGVFTMPGPNSTFPRERPRAARFLEIFACREFNPPPPEEHFAPVGDDLARTGQCQHCHALMDPVAMAFRRWGFVAYGIPLPRIIDLADLRVPADLFDPARNYQNYRWVFAGSDRWRLNWLPNTTMTPVTQAQLTARLGAMFVDTIPPEYTVLGQHPDGTMGPLGFAKVLVSSGEFDRCAARRLYERVVGRPLDPAREQRYIDALAAQFAARGRSVRPFIRYLVSQPEFRRGFQ